MAIYNPEIQPRYTVSLVFEIDFFENPRKDWKNEFNIGKEMTCEDWNDLKNGNLIITFIKSVSTTRLAGFEAV